MSFDTVIAVDWSARSSLSPRRPVADAIFICCKHRAEPPEHPLYSWWSYRARNWSAADKGRRLDHVWVTGGLAERVRGAQVHRDVRGWEKASDHAPVTVDID